jgi:hypothetical protein
MRANRLRLWFASLAHVLLAALRRIGPRHTRFADATGRHAPPRAAEDRRPQLRVSVRRIKVAMASAFPYQAGDRLAYLRPQRLAS